jgi:twitching motility protein PilT
LSLERLLQQAAKAGGTEVRLVPGRRIVLMTPAGEREVQGQPLTAQAIDQYLGAVMTDDARHSLISGRAEWTWSVDGLGAIQALAEQQGDGTRATFSLGRGGAAPAAAARPAAAVVEAPAAPRRKHSGPTAELDELFTTMCDMKASDLHMSVGSPPMIRHDGEMRPLPGREVLKPADTERILFPIAPQRNKDEFAKRNDTDFAYELEGVGRFRCNFFRDRKGVGGVFRIIPSKIMTAEDMGLSKEILQLCHLPKGLVLVTGPTGSGKSTTLCALIDYINRNRTDHIITIEDPIEFVHENKKCLINQRQVHAHTDSFKDALRAALREDPDIVLVGEMRDLETVAIAIETAETGHLVFGTLHTSSAPSTVDRIIDQFPADRQGQIRVMLAESLKAVISQMLCKKIGGGRVPVMEILISTPSVSNLIREAKIFQIPSIMQTGKKYGMCQMNESITEVVRKKIVDPQEAYAKAVDKAGLINMFKKSNIDTSWAPVDKDAPSGM